MKKYATIFIVSLCVIVVTVVIKAIYLRDFSPMLLLGALIPMSVLVRLGYKFIQGHKDIYPNDNMTVLLAVILWGIAFPSCLGLWLVALNYEIHMKAVEPPEPVLEGVGVVSELGEPPGNLTPETPGNLTLEPPPLVIIDGQKFEFVITSESDTEFHADIRIVNLTKQAVDGWKLSFSGDFVITEIRNAKLIGSENSRHEVINEFWTKAINPHSSAIFSITAEKSGEKPAGSEAVLDNFVLVEFSQPEEPEIPAEMTAVTLHIFSELGYNVLLWDIDDATETYTIFRNGEEITSVNNQNFYLDTNVSEDSIYEYYIVQTLDEITLQSNQVTVTTTAAEPHGISAREQISNLQSDIRTPIIFQETNSYQYVSRDLELITEVENGSTITWFSSAEQIISPQGTVTRPTGGFFPVTLTSVWRNGEFEIRRKHNLNVAPLNNVENEKMTWEDLVEMNDEEIRITENRNGNINRLGGNLSQSSVHSIEDAFAFIESVSDIIDISNNESELRLNNFSDNNIDFNQYYKDIRVQNAIVRVFIDVETGIVKSLMNSFAPNIDMDINPNISAEEIKQIILIEHGINVIGEPELIIRYDLTSDPNLRLAWLINEKMDGEICIDANTGEVVYRVGNPT